jgi:hypothetical protein
MTAAAAGVVAMLQRQLPIASPKTLRIALISCQMRCHRRAYSVEPRGCCGEIERLEGYQLKLDALPPPRCFPFIPFAVY